MLQRNVGTTDRIIRAVIGLALISFTIVGPQSAWGWLGLVPLLTAVLGHCPLYAPLGLNTCRAPKP